MICEIPTGLFRWGFLQKDFTTLANESIMEESKMPELDFRTTQEETMEKNEKQERLNALYRLIAEIRDPGDVEILFEDLCTRKEVENMAERIFAAKLLLEGKTYNQVMSQADISSATLSRVSRCVQYGSGYSKLLKPREE